MWTRSFRPFKKSITVKHSQGVAKIALDAMSGIVLGTPVDKGFARGSWQATKDFPSDAEGKNADPSGYKVTSEAALVFNGKDEFPVYYITNNLPYIQSLEKGSSSQAPSGMVQLTLDRIERQFS